ncbi:hypothetical protein SESBI_07988 [Sesbania bispinosa]|nr:hypothetical protein SESBI_07988 [Sesbania bispinosa]
MQKSRLGSTFSYLTLSIERRKFTFHKVVTYFRDEEREKSGTSPTESSKLR